MPSSAAGELDVGPGAREPSGESTPGALRGAVLRAGQPVLWSEPVLRARAALGAGALLAIIAASWYLAVGAAGGRYLLELPTSADPGWIGGPLRSLAGGGEWLQPPQLSAGLIVLVAGYVLALWCAGSISPRIALTAVVLANVAFTLGPTIVSTDVFGYIAYARELALHGHDPYVSLPASLTHNGILKFVYWKHQASPYGPLFTILSVPLGLVPGAIALWLFKCLAGAASVALAFLVSTVARQRGLNRARAAILIGLNPALLFYAVSGAHNDLLAVCLAVMGVALVLRNMEGRGAAAAVAAAAVKLTVGLALPFVLILARRRGRAFGGVALAAVVIGLPTLVLFGLHFVSQLQRISTDPLFDTVFSGPDRIARALGTHITPTLRALCTAGAGLAALAAFVWGWRSRDAITAAGWAFLALIASIASFAPWYLVWLLPFAALGRSRSLRLVTVLVTVYVMSAHIPAFGEGVPWLSQPPGSKDGATAAAGVHPVAVQGQQRLARERTEARRIDLAA